MAVLGPAPVGAANRDFGQHWVDRGQLGKGDDLMVLLLLAVARQALQPQFVPAEALAKPAGDQDRRLYAAHRHRDVGARRQPARPAQRARLAGQAEIPVGKDHRRDAARETDQQQRQQRADPRDPAMREQPLVEPVILGEIDPVHRIEGVEFERQQPVEKLHGGADHGERGEREIEQSRDQQLARRHREQQPILGHGHRFGGVGRGYRSRRFAAAMGADRRAQRLRFVQPDRVEAGVILLAAGAGFEPDLGDAQRARHQPLFDADVLDAVERNGAVLARQHPAFDHHGVGADDKTKAQPLEPRGDQRDQQEGEDRRDDIDPVAGKAERGDRGQEIERAWPELDDRERQRRRMQPLPVRLGLRRGSGQGGFAHAKSVWIWRRIVSRIAAARSARSPGSVTVLLWVPDVWTIRCDSPNQRSTGPCPTSIC